MATSTPAYVTPQVLRWARESLGLELEQAATLIKAPAERLARAEAGEGHLTLRQAERAAKVYDRTLATLFLPDPPEEEPQDATATASTPPSLLLHEGRSVIYVARQLGHGADLTLGTYGHTIEELDDAAQIDADEAIAVARARGASSHAA